MNTKLILATLAGGILYFLLGWLIYGVLLMDFSMANTTQYAGLMKDMPDLLVLFLGNLSFALLMAWIFQKWANISCHPVSSFIGCKEHPFSCACK